MAALRARWFGEWFLAELAALTDDGRFAESHELVQRYLSDETIKGPSRSMLEAVQAELPALEQRHAATEAGRPTPSAEP